MILFEGTYSVDKGEDFELFIHDSLAKSRCQPGKFKVWSLPQFYSVDFSKSRICVEKVRFQQTHNQGLRQLLLTVSWDLRA